MIWTGFCLACPLSLNAQAQPGIEAVVPGALAHPSLGIMPAGTRMAHGRQCEPISNDGGLVNRRNGQTSAGACLRAAIISGEGGGVAVHGKPQRRSTRKRRQSGVASPCNALKDLSIHVGLTGKPAGFCPPDPDPEGWGNGRTRPALALDVRDGAE